MIERWRQHYDEHLNGAQANNRAFDGNDYVGASTDGDVPVPPMNEVKEAIQQLKNNKAAGEDGLGIELFKFGPEKLAECMHRIIERIWDSEQLLEEWKEGVVTSIYKKGDKLDCENYRAITVSNAAYKVLSQILFRRLSSLVNGFVRSYQAGFNNGKS